MEIKTESVKELSYNELVNIEKNIEYGDLIIIKEKKAKKWNVQYVTLITDMGIYIHPDKNGLDGGGIILWPEHMKIQHVKKQNMYDDTVFIHIPIEN